MTVLQMGLFEKLLVLSGESTVPVQLLAEDKGLLTLIKSGVTQEDCLDYINESY